MLLECGHGGLCYDCALRVFAKSAQECPLCRHKISRVVKLGDAARRVGDAVVVDVEQ